MLSWFGGKRGLRTKGFPMDSRSHGGEGVLAMAERPRPAQTVYGYYDQNNVGDEAFKAVFQDLFGVPHVEFVGNMERARRRDHVVFGGGAVFNHYFVDQLRDAGSIYAVGCSLPHGRNDINVVLPLRHKFKCFYVRSRDDVTLFEQAGMPAVYTPDIVFALRPPKIDFTLQDFLPYTNLPPVSFGSKAHTVIVFLSDDYTVVYSEERAEQFQRAERMKRELAAALDILAEKCNIVCVPMSVWYSARDYIYAIDVVRRMRNHTKVCVVERYIEPMRLLGAVNALDATVLSMKFHGLVFGLMTGKLVVNIGATRKNVGMMREADLSGLSFSYDTVTARAIVDAVGKHTEARVQAKIAAIGRDWGAEARRRLAEFKALLPD